MKLLGIYGTKEEAEEAHENILWYIGKVGEYEYGYQCWYCGGTPTEFAVFELSDGTVMGNQVCARHAAELRETTAG